MLSHSDGTQAVPHGEDYVNDPSIEAVWAIRAFENAQLHMNMLCATNPRDLKLSPLDDEIYAAFRTHFPTHAIDVLNEDELKSDAGKSIWRPFLMSFEQKIEDYNYGTLLRLDSRLQYDSENSILVPKVQFLAIEIARNREGHNSHLRDKFRPSYPNDSGS